MPAPTAPSAAQPTTRTLERRVALQNRIASRGAVSFSTAVKIGIGWVLFLVMALFYAMLPIASLQLLPFLFFGVVCLLTSLYDDAGLNGQ
ncbi:MAG TPA: hypothetical protein VLC09_05495 [Polyangiaceae bacterium]|nr:hypothetical protein [Polyangiaceae bacterium]